MSTSKVTSEQKIQFVSKSQEQVGVGGEFEGKWKLNEPERHNFERQNSFEEDEADTTLV